MTTLVSYDAESQVQF